MAGTCGFFYGSDEGPQVLANPAWPCATNPWRGAAREMPMGMSMIPCTKTQFAWCSSLAKPLLPCYSEGCESAMGGQRI